jgi:hypothetical protein
VVACDINPVQLAYAERRLAGGAIEVGDAELGVSIARLGMPLIGWREAKVREFLRLSSGDEQLRYWSAHLDTHRFRAGFDLMMSPLLLRLVYSPELLSCLPPRLGAVLRMRLARGFGRHPNRSNPYLHALFLGESLGVDARSSRQVELVEADAASYLEQCEAGSFDGFTISNILDGAPAAYRARLGRAIRRAASQGAVLVHRSFAEPTAEITGNRAIDDRALLWGVAAVVDARSAF